MTPLLIGLSGRKRSGKDTFAERLITAHGFVRVAFADRMREAALALDPWVKVHVEDRWHPERLSEVIEFDGWEAAKENPEVRRTLQRLGTEMGRTLFGENFWVDLALDDVVNYMDAGRSVVITDVRFPNEMAAVEHGSGINVRIERPSLPASGDLHPSETALDGASFDFTVYNASTIANLHAEADAVVHRLQEK